MLLIALVWVAKLSNIPVRDDWLLVAPLTGNEPDLLKWLWAQNLEHRIPVPWLILLGLLKLTNGDFRIGMVFNVITLGAISFAMVLVARYLRGGRTSFADAFFPIALLHLGNWENLFWSCQITFVLPTALTLTLLLVLVGYNTLATPVAALIAGTCLMLLPLCGANGLMIVPLMALWLIYCGITHSHAMKAGEGRLWISIFLVYSSTIALIISALYFVDYQHPTVYPRSPNFLTTLLTAAKFLAYGFGQAAARSWNLSVTFSIVFLLSSAVVVIISVLRNKSSDRLRAFGIFLFFVNFAIFALGFGWGRAGKTLYSGYLSHRYVLLAVPVWCTAYFIWGLYGSPKIRIAAQYVLFIATLISLPFNTKGGLSGGSWDRDARDRVELDILTGTPRSILAERHRDLAVGWWDETELAKAMQMLHDAGVEPFSKMKDDTLDK
jgi:hypothetical protein